MKLDVWVEESFKWHNYTQSRYQRIVDEVVLVSTIKLNESLELQWIKRASWDLERSCQIWCDAKAFKDIRVGILHCGGNNNQSFIPTWTIFSKEIFYDPHRKISTHVIMFLWEKKVATLHMLWNIL